MTNITPVISSILIESQADPIPEPYYSFKDLDTFLQEAYRINGHISSLLSYLREIRQPYLSTAPPPRRHNSTSHQNNTPTYLTDPQRSEIDSSTSLLLQDLSRNISSFSQAEALRVQTESMLLERKYGKPNSFLWKWATADGVEDPLKSKEQQDDEGRAQTMKTVRGSVIWYLESGLARAMDTQREMVEIRVEREREKEKSVLWKLNATAADKGFGMNGSVKEYQSSKDMQGKSYNPEIDPSYDPSTIESQLSPEQLQLFTSENSSLLNHYNDTLSKVTQAEESILEIAALQQTLVSHLTTQGEMIEQLVTDVQNTDENVRRGNKELKKASERGSTAKMVFWTTVGICGFLVGWDLVF